MVVRVLPRHDSFVAAVSPAHGTRRLFLSFAQVAVLKVPPSRHRRSSSCSGTIVFTSTVVGARPGILLVTTNDTKYPVLTVGADGKRCRL